MRNCFHRYSKFAVGIFVLIAALSLIHWIGDSGYFRPGGLEAKVVVEPNVLDEEMPVLDRTHAAVRAVMEVQERHTDTLMVEPGILGTATGVTREGRPAILVFAKSYELAKAAFIPADIEGVPVIVRITGEIKALKPPAGRGKEKVDPTARFDRPVPIGVSTGHPNITAGTIGCRVTDGTNVYALSNNHVYANENMANPGDNGDNVLQPGPYDGGIDTDDAIGTLADFEPIVFSWSANNTIDAAIALSSTDLLGNATPSDGYGIPKYATVEPGLNQKVKKYGRTTRQTKGQVYAINATVSVGYDTGVARFVNQIIIIPGDFSAPGDSGSLVVLDAKGRDKRDDRKPVGLLFAGSDFLTVANPIGAVLDRFGVTVDGE